MLDAGIDPHRGVPDGSLCDAPGVGDLSALDRPDLREFQRDHGHGFTIERHEPDFVRFPIAMDVYDRPHIPGGELLARQVGRKHYPIMLFGCWRTLPLSRICTDQPRPVFCFDDPYRAYQRRSPIGSLQRSVRSTSASSSPDPRP